METLQPGGTPGTRSDMSVLTCEYALMAAVYAEPTTCSRRSHKSPAGHCPAGLLSAPAPRAPSSLCVLDLDASEVRRDDFDGPRHRRVPCRHEAGRRGERRHAVQLDPA